jgi:hypothetical protein
MRKIITNAQLQEAVREAKSIPGMRLGQHVWNKFCSETALEDCSAALFYCDDADFWNVVFDFVTVEN